MPGTWLQCLLFLYRHTSLSLTSGTFKYNTNSFLSHCWKLLLKYWIFYNSVCTGHAIFEVGMQIYLCAYVFVHVCMHACLHVCMHVQQKSQLGRNTTMVYNYTRTFYLYHRHTLTLCNDWSYDGDQITYTPSQHAEIATQSQTCSWGWDGARKSLLAWILVVTQVKWWTITSMKDGYLVSLTLSTNSNVSFFVDMVMFPSYVKGLFWTLIFLAVGNGPLCNFEYSA